MAIIKIRNAAIDLDAAEIPNISASKITSGTMDAARIGSGTFADARIAASNVSQHATSFDDNKIVNDISTLAIRQASNENKGAYNTNSMYVDVFQDATGVTNLTNTQRNDSEYISSAVNSDQSVTINNSNYTTYINSDPVIHHANQSSFSGVPGGTYTTISNYGTASNAVWDSGSNNNLGTKGSRLFNTANLTTDYLLYNNVNSGTTNYFIVWVGLELTTPMALRDYGLTWRNGSGNYWTTHMIGFANSSGGSGVTSDNALGGLRLKDGNSISNGSAYAASSAWSGYSGAGWASNTTKLSYYWIETFHYNGTNSFMFNNLSLSGIMSVPSTSATGSFESNAITAPSSTNKMGAIITYQDNAGTNTLNTDVILKLSADGGSNYSTATMTAMPDFASGIKMAKVNDLSVTAGTSLKYKIEFANQSSGSKEARIRGVSLQY